jgi:hypothetical protein
MKMLIPVLLAFSITMAFSIAGVSAFLDTGTFSSSDLDDNWFDSTAPTTNNAPGSNIYIGSNSFTINYSSIFKFDISSITNPTSARFCIYDIAGFNGYYYLNYTLWGTDNQTWVEETITYNAVNSVLRASNWTLVAWNNTYSGYWWTCFDVTNYVTSQKSNGFSNITFYVNFTVNSTSSNWHPGNYSTFRQKEHGSTIPTLNTTATFYNNITDCNATTLGKSSCSNDGFGLVQCRRFSYNQYDWDYSNITYCPDGCVQAQCLEINKTCRNDCINGSIKCIDDISYVQCENNTFTGCYGWGDKSDCRYGCKNGECKTGLSICTPHEMKCIENKITWCLDENHDGYYSWSKINVTDCTYQCVEQIINGKVNASCTYHSLTSEAYGLTNITTYYVTAVNYIFDTFKLKLIFVMLVTLVLGGLVGAKTGSTPAAIIAMIFPLLFFVMIGWFPWTFFLLVGIIGSMFLFGINKVTQGEEGDNNE